MWVRKRFDIGWSDIFYGLAAGLIPGQRERRNERVCSCWSDADDAIVCLSVRTGFDLLFQTLALPAGSEVLFSALTIPDMAKIARHHGLTPVPVDLDREDLKPNIERLRAAITSKTRMLVVAHLFGTRCDMEPLIALTKEHDILLVEDCAQVYDGGKYQGHPKSDVAMFSFGAIKTATALGGGVLIVRDQAVLGRMRRLQEDYPLQDGMRYLRRLAKYGLMKMGSWQVVFTAIVAGFRLTGRDYDHWMNGLARGFRGDDLIAMLRHRPASPLLAVLARRLSRYNRRRLEVRRRKGLAMLEMLGEQESCPGSRAPIHSFWVFPVYAELPTVMIELLAAAGFDATQGQSMTVIQKDDPARGEDGSSRQLAPVAHDLLEHMVFLPFYPGMSERGLRKMADVILDEYPARLAKMPDKQARSGAGDKAIQSMETAE